MIPGEESPRQDPRSGVVASVQESIAVWNRVERDSVVREYCCDITASAARFAGERDTFARTTTADQAYRQ